ALADGVAERQERLLRVVADGGHGVAGQGLVLAGDDEVGEGAEGRRVAERRGRIEEREVALSRGALVRLLVLLVVGGRLGEGVQEDLHRLGRAHGEERRGRRLHALAVAFLQGLREGLLDGLEVLGRQDAEERDEADQRAHGLLPESGPADPLSLASIKRDTSHLTNRLKNRRWKKTQRLPGPANSDSMARP